MKGDQVNITRVTTIGSDVLINSGVTKLHRIIGEAASTGIVLLKDNAVTRASIAVGGIPNGSTGVPFDNALFVTDLTVNIASGANILIVWSPV